MLRFQWCHSPGQRRRSVPAVKLINSAVYAMQMLQTQMAGEAEISGLTTDEAVMDLVAGIRAESET